MSKPEKINIKRDSKLSDEEKALNIHNEIKNISRDNMLIGDSDKFILHPTKEENSSSINMTGNIYTQICIKCNFY